MLKYHKLFNVDDDPDCFSAAIAPTPEQKRFLIECKNKIRDHLRTGIAAASVQVLGMEHKVEPRFRTQGSWSYKTCNQPARRPPQEIDWDFGNYLPALVWENRQPKVAAKLYFELAERLLKSLCDREGWTLLTGADAKDNCIRILVSGWAHIDVPLYAAPEEKFVQIMEKAATMDLASNAYARDSVYLAESAALGELPAFEWEDLDEIVLATRTGVWKPSDPHEVSRWWFDRMAEAGAEQLRRVCCYLKAWRDFQWVEGGPSSVLLMICAVRDFQPRHGRDDLALEDAAARVAKLLKDDVYEPGIGKGEENFNRLTAAQRIDASARADKLSGAIHWARTYGPGMKLDGINKIREHLGTRVPLRVDLVETDGGEAAVRATPAMTVAPPVVGSTKAG